MAAAVRARLVRRDCTTLCKPEVPFFAPPLVVHGSDWVVSRACIEKFILYLMSREPQARRQEYGAVVAFIGRQKKMVGRDRRRHAARSAAERASLPAAISVDELRDKLLPALRSVLDAPPAAPEDQRCAQAMVYQSHLVVALLLYMYVFAAAAATPPSCHPNACCVGVRQGNSCSCLCASARTWCRMASVPCIPASIKPR